MDVYKQARRYPWRLSKDLEVTRYRDLRHAGTSEDAIRWRTERGRLVRPHHGVYLRGCGPPTLLDDIHAALLAAPPHAVLGFHTAALLYGFGVARTDAVHLLVPAGTPFPQRPGIAAHQVVLPIGDPVDILGLPCAPPQRCAIDLARCLRRLDALPVLDAALFSGSCGPDALLAEVGRHDGLRGVRQARELVVLADGRAECRQESQLRLVLYDGGIRGLVPQVVVVDGNGRTRHRIDLADEEAKVGAEYDGSSHLDRRRLRADRARHNWLESQGWAMRYFTDQDLYGDPDAVVTVLARAGARLPRRSRANPRD